GVRDEAQVVHERAARDDLRRVFLRRNAARAPRGFRGSDHAQLPPSARRPRPRRLTVVAHVAHDDLAEQLPLTGGGLYGPRIVFFPIAFFPENANLSAANRALRLSRRPRLLAFRPIFAREEIYVVCRSSA